VGTDLARRAPARPDALTPTLAPRVARSLARFRKATAFDQPLNSWDTSSVRDMFIMWVLTSPAVRSPAPDSPTLTLAPRVARSLDRFEDAKNFNQDLSGWVVNNVKDCFNFCKKAGFNPTSRIPSFQKCGKPKC